MSLDRIRRNGGKRCSIWKCDEGRHTLFISAAFMRVRGEVCTEALKMISLLAVDLSKALQGHCITFIWLGVFCLDPGWSCG